MELLHVVVIVPLLGFLDAKSCYFLTKTSYWGLNDNDGKANPSLSVFYKTKLSNLYCSYDKICCGQSCCPDPSITPKYDSSDDDSQMSTGSSLGVAFAVVVGFSFCMSCCIACCKQQKNERQNVTVSNVQPIVAYSSDNGAVIIRQVPRDNTSFSSPASSSPGGGDISSHDTSQPYAASETYGFNSLDTRENEAPPYESANLLQITEPPPSYEYVMSHNYPTNSDNENSSAKTSNEP